MERLRKFLRGLREEASARDVSVLQAALKVAELIATPTHLVGVAALGAAILNSDQEESAGRMTVISFMRSKAHPVNVTAVALQLPEWEMRSWTEEVDGAAKIVDRWWCMDTPLLDEIDGIFLRCCKASLIDLFVLLGVFIFSMKWGAIWSYEWSFPKHLMGKEWSFRLGISWGKARERCGKPSWFPFWKVIYSGRWWIAHIGNVGSDLIELTNQKPKKTYMSAFGV